MFRYSVYCTEYGNGISNPYDEDNSIDTAIEICKAMAKATKCRWYVFDNRKSIDVYLIRGDICNT